MNTRTLNNGIEMPLLGYGVYQVEPSEAQRCVSEAIESGYRLIDTAQAYANEEGVGAAVAASGLPREDFFLVTKMWPVSYLEGAADDSIDRSLEVLGTDYIDLMILHQPIGDFYMGYRALEKAYGDGKIRAIGISNFSPVQTLDIATFASVIPAVNQVELHVFYQQKELRGVLDQFDIAPMAWGPFAEGANGIFTDPTLSSVGEKYGKSAAQVALRFLVQQGIIAIPKSTHQDRMAQNIDVFDFELSGDDMAAIEAMDTGANVVFSHADVATMGWLMNKIKEGQGAGGRP